MKTIMTGLFALVSLSTANAKLINVPNDVPLSEVIKTAYCEVNILKPIIFGKGLDISSSGTFHFLSLKRENTVRRLPMGRVLSIARMDEDYIIFKDKSIALSCLGPSFERCSRLGTFTINEIQTGSENAVSITCKDENVTDF